MEVGSDKTEQERSDGSVDSILCLVMATVCHAWQLASDSHVK